MKKFLAILLLSVSTVVGAQNVSPTSTVEPGQVYSTGNLVNNTQTATDTTSTWQNVVFQQGLTCWAPGGPGNCGPMPTIQPNSGSMNFSYGLTDVYQVVNISNALANAGTGLRVNGFNFGFTAKNGNGWDDGRVDTLSAYVNFYDKNNNLATNYYYDLNYKFDWTTFYYSKTFDNPYAVSDLSNVRYGFVGKDNNFWAGTYGPEIYGVNFSLKYSVDPCIKDPLNSPTCPGYMDALNKLIAPTTTTPIVQETTVIASAPIVSEPVVSTQSSTSAATQSTQVATVQVVQPVVSQPSSTQTTVSQSVTPQTTVAQTSSSQTQQQTSGPSLSTVLNMIQNNAKREQTIAAAAVASANETAQNAVQVAEQTALTVAATSSAASMTVSTAKTEQKAFTPTTQSSSSSISQLVANSSSMAVTSTSSTSQQFMLAPTQNNQSTFVNSSVTVANTQTVATTTTQGPTQSVQNNTNVNTMANNVQTTTTSMAPPTPTVRTAPVQTASVTTTATVVQPIDNRPIVASVQPNVQPLVMDTTPTLLQAPMTIEAPKSTVQVAKVETMINQDNDFIVFANNFLTNRANPLTEIVENNTRPTNNTVEQKDRTLNRNAANNELAGGVQLETMATQPAGYNSYLQFAMRDVAFYAPKEIYRNQRVIDNQRAVRLLNFASELKHQEMVNQQYGERK